MTAQISEIFKSIQGEGLYAGVAQVFVRFFACHMHCDWCDTPESIGDKGKAFKEYTIDTLAAEVSRLTPGCHSVSLTGGEPLLQADFLKEFIPLIRGFGAKAYLETSGVLHKELLKIASGVDIVAMDLKLPSSTGCRPYWTEHEMFLNIAARKEVFVKAVIAAKTTAEDFRTAVELIRLVSPEIVLYVQPNTFDLDKGVLDQCLAFQEEAARSLKDVRLLPQMHKFINLR